ncbi:MAG: hypothetical protein MJ191_07135, partial [Clostridium sp.]|nr:hypothetical protein [Clostridium sp.]
VRINKKNMSKKSNREDAAIEFEKRSVDYRKEVFSVLEGYSYLSKEQLRYCVDKAHKSLYHIKISEKHADTNWRRKMIKVKTEMSGQMEGIMLMAMLWDTDATSSNDLQESIGKMFQDTYTNIIGIKPEGDVATRAKNHLLAIGDK